MHFSLRPILFSIAAAFLLTGCLQDSETTRIPVRYTVLVRDGQTGKAIKGAEVSLTGEDETESTLKTNENGKVVFPSIESYVNQVIVTKKGYIPTDTVDAVTETDTTLKVILDTLTRRRFYRRYGETLQLHRHRSGRIHNVKHLRGNSFGPFRFGRRNFGNNRQERQSHT